MGCSKNRQSCHAEQMRGIPYKKAITSSSNIFEHPQGGCEDVRNFFVFFVCSVVKFLFLHREDGKHRVRGNKKETKDNENNVFEHSLMPLDYFELGDIVRLIPEQTKSS